MTYWWNGNRGLAWDQEIASFTPTCAVTLGKLFTPGVGRKHIFGVLRAQRTCLVAAKMSFFSFFAEGERQGKRKREKNERKEKDKRNGRKTWRNKFLVSGYGFSNYSS